MKMVCVAAVLLVSALQGGAAASLRAAPPAKGSAKEAAPKTEAKAALKTDLKVAGVSDKVADTIAKALAAAPAAKTAAAETAPAATVTHKKLDVGFSDFEKNLTEEVSAKLLRTATGTAWNDDMRAKFDKNVTASIKDTLKVILKPLKMTIGKTWMALPKDSQKDEYVDTLKKSFVSVFENSMKTVSSHLELGLKRVETLSKEKRNSTELLEKAEFSIEDSLITEHCYEVAAKKNLKSIKTPANASEVLADKKKFCIQSVIGALAHRLNDTQGLISMSMRFEAGAMSLAQKNHKKPLH